VFKILNGIFSEFYNPFENVAIDDIIISFKGRAIFKQYINNNKKKKQVFQQHNFQTL
jgi:hypothetical protein